MIVLPHRPIKIGLLVTEDDEEHGGEQGVADSIKQRLYEVCGRENIDVTDYFIIRGKYPQIVGQNFDGFIITGSHHSVNDDSTWIRNLEEFVLSVKNTPNAPKLVGICFGHQLVAKAFGGKVGTNPNEHFIWKSGRVYISTDLSKKHYYQAALGNEADYFHIMQSHYEQILVMPSNGHSVGSCQECEHEVVLYGEDEILTVQGHPEVTVDKMLNISLPLLKRDGKITEDEEAIARESFSHENGDALVNLIINFLKP